MSTGKKFNIRVIQKDDTWTTEIVRRVSSKKNHISKSQSGFTSEANAEDWGQKELKNFLQNLNVRNKRPESKKA